MSVDNHYISSESKVKVIGNYFIKYLDDDVSEIRNLEKKGWRDKPNFDEHNKNHFVTYKGRNYQLKNKIHDYSVVMRFLRGLLGVFGGVVILCTTRNPKSVRRLFTKKYETKIFGIIHNPPISSSSDTNPSLLVAKLDKSQIVTQEQHTTPEIEINNNRFASNADKWSFLKGCLNQYRDVIYSTDDLWNTDQAKVFLHSELKTIEKDIKELENVIIELEGIQKQKINNEEYEEVTNLITNIIKLQNEFSIALTYITTKLPKSDPEKSSVTGLANAGNTCYMNSALQPLLCINNFPNLVPKSIQKAADESEKNFQGRKTILAVFNEFIEAWKDKRSAEDLGQLIGKMRITIFQAGLSQGAFTDRTQEKKFQDAGQFFELILHVIGQGFKAKETQRPFKDKEYKFPINYSKIDTNPQGHYMLQGEHTSVQGAVDQAGSTKQVELTGDPWGFKVNDIPMKTQYVTQETKILGTPPELIVFRFDHQVNPSVDSIVNLESLFEDKIKVAKYELVGFCQNHDQRHWTSVVKENRTWKYCNDSVIRVVEPSDTEFKILANYLVYKKVNPN